MVDGKSRHIVVLKLLMLIIAKHYHDIRIYFLQSISQSFNGFLARLIALVELFRGELSLEIRFRPPQQALIIQPRVVLVLFPQHLPIGGGNTELGTVRCANAKNDFSHDREISACYNRRNLRRKKPLRRKLYEKAVGLSRVRYSDLGPVKNNDSTLVFAATRLISSAATPLSV